MIKTIRRKYIRFFVSSTFLDMTRERNLLQSLLNKLSDEYMKRGWQIEMVDLRWGISKEAGLENRTMQICEEELLRCQQLSPRPNFIILLGNRYGWIPLPERIAPAEAAQLQMTENERILFNQWYKLDENILMEGAFVLQGRIPPYDDDSTWEKEVERPLCEMFLRNERRFLGFWNFINRKPHVQLYGKSATEKEIEIGALSVPDASEHVIAYFRNLAEIPKDVETVFCECDKHLCKSLSDLKERITKCLSTDNVYVDNLSYLSYQSKDWSTRFVSEMERRIRHVVDACIQQYDLSAVTDENEEHLLFALENASHFVGREQLLTEINRFILDPEENRPLWIKSHSGSGKSALLSKIVADYQHSLQIICRFCGLTNQSMDEESFFHSLYDAIPHKRQMPDYGTSRYHFGEALKKLQPVQPTLIVLDALNQLEPHGFGLENFTWLHFKFHNNLKIIVSSTDELRFTKEPAFMSVIHLPDMNNDSEQMVLDILQRNSRCLSPSQRTTLTRIIAASDGSALYLRMLGYYLSGVPSWADIAHVPSDLNGLVRLMMDEMSQPERHGKDLLFSVLNLLVNERLGLSDREVLALLSADKSLVESLQTHSFHSLLTSDHHQLPIVLWSRLRHDLLPFLRTFVSVAGQMNAIFHSGLRQVLRNYLNECRVEEDTAHRLLFNYYAQKSLVGNKHALLEVIHCACYPYSPIATEAANFLKSHLHFLLTKYSLFPKELTKDFDELIHYADESERNEIYLLRNSITSLPVDVTAEQLLLYMMNLPHDSVLHQLAIQEVSFDEVMDNLLADVQPKDTAVFTLSEIGEKPCMSDDGTIVASLFQNRHEVRVEDTTKPGSEKIILTFHEEILSMSCTEDMRLLLIHTGNEYAVCEVSSGRAVISCRLTERPWASLSAKGEQFAFGDATGTWVYDLPQGMKAQLKASYLPAFGGCLSSSGAYLWLLREDRSLYRICLEGGQEKYPNLPFREKHKAQNLIEGALTDLQTAILAASNHCCACYHDNWLLYVICHDDGSASIEIRKYNLFGDSNIIISNDEKSVFYSQPPYSMMFTVENGYELFASQNYVDPQCVNSHLSLALWNGRIIDLRQQMTRFVVSEGNVGGINSLSASAQGDRAIISVGQNIGMEKRWEVLKVEKRQFTTWLPPFTHRDYRFVIASRVSPDGSLYALSSHSMDSTFNELLLFHNDDSTSQCISTGDSGCLGLDISQDSQYIAAMKGDYIADPSPVIYLLSRQGRLLKEIPAEFPHTTKEGIRLSLNNRYLVVMDYLSYSVFDMLSGSTVDISTHQTFPFENCSLDYSLNRPVIALLPFPQLSLLSTDGKNKTLFRLDLITNKAYSVSFEMHLQATSPTGRLIYVTDNNHQLYMIDYLSGSEYVSIMEHVLAVMPALDEAHIYILQDNFVILLYNVGTQSVEQIAYCGKSYFQTVCAQGLYVANVNGDVSLLQPRKELHVNVPAVTTFVRRFHFENNEYEQPSAICPMCGATIVLTPKLSEVLIDCATQVRADDYDDIRLLGHHCPHCSAELQFNPYIL